MSLFWSSLIFIWITAIPLFISLYLFYLISGEIIKVNPFCLKNVTRLTVVSRLALFESGLYLFALVVLFFLGVFHICLLIIIIIVMFFALAMYIITSLFCLLLD